MFLQVSVCPQAGWYPSMPCRWYPSMPCSRSPWGVPAHGGACSQGACSQGVPAPGGGACSQMGGCLLPGGTCSWWVPIPGDACSGGCLLLGRVVVETPLPADGYCCGRYAFYRNAFLCFKIKTLLLFIFSKTRDGKNLLHGVPGLEMGEGTR